MIPAKQFDLCPWNKLIALPHMGWQHAGWFASYVVNAKNILEWGCGGSTLWMAMMNPKAALYVIEHNERWVDKVHQALDVVNRVLDCNRDYTFYYAPDSESYVGGNEVRDAFGLFDLISVDGHERPACLAASYDLLAPGGVVFLHDSQRAEYSKAKQWMLTRVDMTLIDERVDESWVNPIAGMWAAQKSG